MIEFLVIAAVLIVPALLMVWIPGESRRVPVDGFVVVEEGGDCRRADEGDFTADEQGEAYDRMADAYEAQLGWGDEA